MTTTTMTITVTTPFTEQDIQRLQALLRELNQTGRREEAGTIARAHAVVEAIVNAGLYAAIDEDDDDDEFAREMEEAERDFAAGNWIADEDVMRRLEALGDE